MNVRLIPLNTNDTSIYPSNGPFILAFLISCYCALQLQLLHLVTEEIQDPTVETN
jgi:hypothetical protein